MVCGSSESSVARSRLRADDRKVRAPAPAEPPRIPPRLPWALRSSMNWQSSSSRRQSPPGWCRERPIVGQARGEERRWPGRAQRRAAEGAAIPAQPCARRRPPRDSMDVRSRAQPRFKSGRGSPRCAVGGLPGCGAAGGRPLARVCAAPWGWGAFKSSV